MRARLARRRCRRPRAPCLLIDSDSCSISHPGMKTADPLSTGGGDPGSGSSSSRREEPVPRRPFCLPSRARSIKVLALSSLCIAVLVGAAIGIWSAGGYRQSASPPPPQKTVTGSADGPSSTTLAETTTADGISKLPEDSGEDWSLKHLRECQSVSVCESFNGSLRLHLKGTHDDVIACRFYAAVGSCAAPATPAPPSKATSSVKTVSA